jgi:GNAT superfamily N-acetyltransferase
MSGPEAIAPIAVTVTFLEMKGPPATVAHPPPNGHLALLRTRDMPLHYYRYLIDRVGRRWHWVNVLRMTDEELSGSIHRPDRDIRVLYLNGSPAGFFDLRLQLPDDVELAYFGMMEHVLGQGLGRWFLAAAVDAAWSYGPRRVSVQTCTLDHPAALPLYQKLGFEPVAQKQEQVWPMSMEQRAESVMRS